MCCKERYDFIFSMGEACSCSSTLRRSGLQFASYPFDWIAGLTFLERAAIIQSHFDSFLNFADLKDIGKDNGDCDNLCEVYYNQKTGLWHNHDFPIGTPLEISFPRVEAKYRTRCNRLYQEIERAKTVLAVYIETPVQNHPFITDEEIQKGYSLLTQTFPGKQINLLYLTNRAGKFDTVKISDNITRLYLNYKRKKLGGHDYSVDAPTLKKVFRNYRLNRSMWKRIRRYFWRFLARFIRNKIARRHFKRRHHV